MDAVIEAVKVNKEQKLFVIPCEAGFTCLGFQVCEDRAIRLGSELLHHGREAQQPAYFGTLERYQQYAEMIDWARRIHERTGYQFHCELEEKLRGFKGMRVEVKFAYGETRRFWVGKSTGWIPVYLALKRRDSSGGDAIEPGSVVSARSV